VFHGSDLFFKLRELLHFVRKLCFFREETIFALPALMGSKSLDSCFPCICSPNFGGFVQSLSIFFDNFSYSIGHILFILLSIQMVDLSTVLRGEYDLQF